MRYVRVVKNFIVAGINNIQTLLAGRLAKIADSDNVLIVQFAILSQLPLTFVSHLHDFSR